MKFLRASIAGAFALGLFSVAPAFADPAPAAGATTPTDTKPFGDWTVRCFPVKTPSPCDMFELLENKATRQRVLSVSIAYLPASDKHVIQIAVPLGVAIQKHLVLTTDTYTSPELHYRRCDRGGCYVEMLMDNDTISALGSATGSAKIRIVVAGGRTFDLPFSLNGFADAHGAMQDLARKKTGKPADAPTAPGPAPAPAPDATPSPTP
jgi:invasion protein IalB